MNILDHPRVQTGVLEVQKLLWRARRFAFGDQSNPRVRLLPASCSAPITPPTRPEPPDPITVRVGKIEEHLGITLRYGPEGEAILIPLNGDGIPRAVGRHDSPPELMDAWKTKVPWTVVLNRAVKVDTRSFELTLEAARVESGGETRYTQLLEEARSWAVPRTLYGSPPLVARELLISAPTEMALPKAGEDKTALVKGEIVSCKGYGDLLWATVCRQPQRPGHGVRTSHPLLLGAPTQIEFAKEHYEVGGECHAIWSIVPLIQRLGEIQQLDIDLLALLENVDQNLWASIYVRGSARDIEGLKELGRTLGAYAQNGRIERVRGFHEWGWNLERAYKAFVPGGVLPPPQNQFLVLHPEAFLNAFTSHVSMAGSITAGDMFVGRANGRPVLIARDERPTVGIEGLPTTGKTTLASFLALTGTPHVLVVHLTSVEGEAPGCWARDFGGQVLNLNLPGAETAKEELELIKADAEEVKQFWARLKQLWLQTGEAVGMPIVLRRESGCPVRFAAYALHFAREYKEAWRLLYKTDPRRRAAIIWDDLVGIPRKKNAFLGDLPVEIGNELKAEIQEQIDSLRKIGMQVYLTLHACEEFLDWLPGMWKSISLFIKLKAGVQHREAVVLDPHEAILEPKNEKDMQLGVLVPNLNPKLPQTITKVVGRKIDLLGLV